MVYRYTKFAQNWKTFGCVEVGMRKISTFLSLTGKKVPVNILVQWNYNTHYYTHK